MAAIDFPASPALNQVFAASTGSVYQWNGTVWVPVGVSGSQIALADTPPASPSPGQLWWNSVLGQLMLWFNDGSSSQWVPASPVPMLGGGTGDFFASHSTTFPLATTAGVIALNTVKSGNSGSWYNISTGRYIPPAGRYFIQGRLTGTAGGASNVVAEIRKNGVSLSIGQSLVTIGSLNMYVEPACDAIVDANGTDFFELWGSSSTGSSGWLGFFLAFPLTGMQGPMGPIGSLSPDIGKRIRGNFGAGGLPNGSWTALGYTVSSNDTGVTPVGNNWTPPAGRWRVGCNLQLVGPNANDCGAGLGINGAITNSQAVIYSPTTGAHIAPCVQDVVDFDGATSMCWMGFSGVASTNVTAQSWWSATRIK